MSLDYLLTWMMVLLRSIGIVMLLPTLAGRPLPVTVRMGLSAEGGERSGHAWLGERRGTEKVFDAEIEM